MICSNVGPITTSENMLTTRWMIPMCRKPEVMSGHHSPFATRPGRRIQDWNRAELFMSMTDRACTAVIR